MGGGRRGGGKWWSEDESKGPLLIGHPKNVSNIISTHTQGHIVISFRGDLGNSSQRPLGESIRF